MKLRLDIDMGGPKDHSPFDGNKRRKEVKDRLKGKKTKSEVYYRPAEGDSKASCIECKFYEFPGQAASSCRKVAGEVEARDVCDMFEPSTDGQGADVQPSKESK